MATNPNKEASFLKTRKMATFLPIVVVPFLTLVFYLFDGGTGQVASAAPVTAGINMDLPKAVNTSMPTSKLSAYGTQQDTLRNRELTNPTITDTASARGLAYGVAPDGKASTAGSDQAVLEAQKQLAAVQAAQQSNGQVSGGTASLTPQQQMEIMQREHEREMAAQRTEMEMARIESQAARAEGGGGGGGGSAPRQVAVVKKKPKTKAVMVDDDAIVSRLGSNGSGRRTASFQGFDSESGMSGDKNTLPAVIHESQEVVSGSLIKMRLTESAVVNGHKLAANTFIYGKCALDGERLTIQIESLKSGGNIFPASMEVYDVDGLQGLHIPGAITRDAAKQAGADGLNGADMLTMSGDPATAAAGVAISAVKGIGQKKIRLVKVRLKAGYNVMLKVDKD